MNLSRLHDAAGFRPGFAMVDRLAAPGARGSRVAADRRLFTHRLSKRDVARANRSTTALGAALVVVIGALILLDVRSAL